MRVTYLGHSGLLFETQNCKALIDPYLSNKTDEISPFASRRYPADVSYLKKRYNVVVITHSHPDHYDKESLKHIFKLHSQITILAPLSVWEDIMGIAENNKCVLFNAGTTYTVNGVSFTATYAEHCEQGAIGVIISAMNNNFYVAGDTLYNEKVFTSIPKMHIDALFVPINGAGNTMNCFDAGKFAIRIDAKKTIPVHYGMFDDLTGHELKNLRPKIKGVTVLKPYESLNM